MAKNLIVHSGWYERRPSDRRLALVAAPFQWLACRLLEFQDRAQQRYALEELDRRLLADVGLDRSDLAATRVMALPERVECLCFARVLPKEKPRRRGSTIRALLSDPP